MYKFNGGDGGEIAMIENTVRHGYLVVQFNTNEDYVGVQCDPNRYDHNVETIYYYSDSSETVRAMGQTK